MKRSCTEDLESERDINRGIKELKCILQALFAHFEQLSEAAGEQSSVWKALFGNELPTRNLVIDFLRSNAQSMKLRALGNQLYLPWNIVNEEISNFISYIIHNEDTNL